MPAVITPRDTMIGGFDRHFALSRRRVSEALDAAARAIFRRWRRAVIQVSDGSIFLTLADVPLSNATELFVYRDLASLRDWEAHGAKPENAAALIHLLADSDGLTIVVGAPRERVAAGVLEEVEQMRFGGDLPRSAP